MHQQKFRIICIMSCQVFWHVQIVTGINETRPGVAIPIPVRNLLAPLVTMYKYAQHSVCRIVTLASECRHVGMPASFRILCPAGSGVPQRLPWPILSQPLSVHWS